MIKSISEKFVEVIKTEQGGANIEYVTLTALMGSGTVVAAEAVTEEINKVFYFVADVLREAREKAEAARR